jgi:hypothetical protein
VSTPSEQAWEAVTWAGSRRAQLRRALALTVRERLQAAEDMAELARHFQRLRETGAFRSPGDLLLLDAAIRD